MERNSKFRRRWQKRFFIHSGILSLAMIGVTSLLHFTLKFDVFILAIGWVGILFMGEYYYQVVMLPLERRIGRLQGNLEVMDEHRKWLEAIVREVDKNGRNKNIKKV